MIEYLKGYLESKSTNNVVIDIKGVGYLVFISLSTFARLPDIGCIIKMYTIETIAGMYNKNFTVSLYGFLSKEEKEMYILVKNEVPGIGAKKSMEYIDKISKSFLSFKKAIITNNQTMLSENFGFTKKSADRLITALKDKILIVNLKEDKIINNDVVVNNEKISEAIKGIVALGYKPLHVRQVVNKIYECNKDITLECLIKKSLQDL
ncbi:MAG: hypothetical protein LBQ07_00680 [Endomicrobium sp.]|jgi:Holliday junction DNA helicase RuvA|nr:hypothetical protein [Endomicrobium sp.]